MVDGNGNRRWSWFESVLLMLVVLCIAVTIPLAATAPSDEVGSLGTVTRAFTVKFAYNIRITPSRVVVDPLWKIILQFEGIQRVKVFLRLLVHNILLTNVERHHHSLTFNVSSEVCGDGERFPCKTCMFSCLVGSGCDYLGSTGRRMVFLVLGWHIKSRGWSHDLQGCDLR
ncbi:hypothetical protein V6N13_026579 [Hibiscus sabdariffa]